MTAPVTKIDELDSAWLTSALQETGRLAASQKVEVVEATELTAGVAFSTRMYRLHLQGPADLPATAIVKLPVEGPVRDLLNAIGAYRKECTFYRDFAHESPVRVPAPLVVVFDEDTSDFVLVIEDLVEHTPMDQLTGMTLAEAETAARELARFHAQWWRHDRLDVYAGSFPALDSATGRGLLGQYGQVFGAVWPAACAATGVDGAVREFGESLPGLLEQLAAALGEPRTLVHGELRAENLFLGAGGELVFVDFQTLQQAAGPVDLAYLISQSLPTEVRRGHDERLVRIYHDELVRSGVADYPWVEAWTAYRLAVAYNLVLPGMAFMTYEHVGERQQALLVAMIQRAAHCIADNDSLSLIQTQVGN
ncbi:phosphotransferase [Sporichthya polymorpha]|uniref:phosphotransferase n=1 Tax=Sporichthya polymorpha TaxID=35751 RepID=UPI0003797046|nr:phosphotransferase [Sporichthya polymorpha]